MSAAIVPTSPPMDVGSAPVAASASRGWLMSRRADFWAAAGGASLAMLPIAAVLYWHGDRELDVMDFVFAELHVGATYDAIVRRKLWKLLPIQVVAVPLVIMVLAYAVMLRGHAILVHTILLYLAVWHRGRQSYGVARYYQRQMGGPISATHDRLFLGAIYIPMIAATLFYTTAYPTHYDGEPYYSLPYATHPIREMIDWMGAAISLGWVAFYFIWTRRKGVHEAERWVVMAHAVAFGSAYFFGAWQASFIIVLAIHHEIQYLYFAYAIARRDPAKKPDGWRREFRFIALFALLPIAGLTIGLGIDHSKISWLTPWGEGLLLSHYWLDACIWKGPYMKPAASSTG